MKKQVAAGVFVAVLGTSAMAQTLAPLPKELPVDSAITVGPEVGALLNQHPNLQQLTEPQLQDRAKKLDAAIANPALPPQLKDLFAAYSRQTKEELARRASASTDGKAKADADAKAASDAQATTDAKVKAAADAKARAVADAKAASDAQAVADVKAKAAADANAKAVADAKAKAAEEKAAFESEASIKARVAAEAKAITDAKVAAEAKAKAAADAKVAADAKAAETKSASEAQAAADAKVKAAADAKMAADAKATADAKAAKAAADAKAASDAQAMVDAKSKAVADAKMSAAAQPVAPPKPSAAPPDAVASAVPVKPVEKAVTAAPAAPPPALAPPPADKVKALAPVTIDASAEGKAKAYASDAVDISRLSDDELRKRLDDVREILAANQLSEPVQRAAREKLLTEREILRQRLATADAKRQQVAAAPPPPPPPASVAIKAPPPAAPPPRGNSSGLSFNLALNLITEATPPRAILEDQRPPEQLRSEELMRRIEVYGDAQRDEQYDPELRDYWRNSLSYDRALLRLRLSQERKRRAAELASEGEMQFAPSARPLPRNIFAAEVGRDTLMAALTAPPPSGFERRVDLHTFVTDPEYRNSIPRIEVDTVHFGYNEGFLREEQLGHLDNIASIIERIVKFHPREVFLIEGHTDARGSDAYNIKLSRLRAASVKAMLVKYYAISPSNLKDVGVGDHFPKIPTADAEPENRRVTIVRATPYLAGLGR